MTLEHLLRLSLVELHQRRQDMADPDKPIPYTLTEEGRRVAEKYAKETLELIVCHHATDNQGLCHWCGTEMET